MSSSRLRKLLLPLLRGYISGKPRTFARMETARQGIFLLGKPSPKRIAAKVRQRSEKQSARASHNQETGAIYQAVRERAGGRCECGCGFAFSTTLEFGPELDHFHGRAKGQSVETCWMLIKAQHQDKTLNRPSREYWDILFAAHCAKYGYEFKGRLIHADLAKAGGAP